MAHWEARPLGEVCNVIGGGTPPKDRPEYYGGDIPWATVRDMRADVIEETEFKITQAAVVASATNVIPAGNVVIATRVGLGKVCLIDQPTAINQDLRGVIPRDPRQLVVKYLFWWLKSVAHLIEKEGTGATVQGVKLPFIKSLPLPLPPISEQRRIVAILDEAFEGIAKARANAERCLANAVILFATMSGLILERLTPVSHISTLEKLVSSDCSLSYGIVQPGDEVSDGMPVVRPVDLCTDVVGLNGLKRINPTLAKAYDRTTLKGNDLLLCVRGSTGVMAIADAELAGANVTRGIVPIRFDESQISQEFGYYLMGSGPVQSQIRERTYGTALMQINIRDLRQLKMPVPPKNEQSVAVKQFDELRLSTNHLIATYERKLSALDSLKKSLLHQAFTGQL